MNFDMQVIKIKIFLWTHSTDRVLTTTKVYDQGMSGFTVKLVRRTIQ